MMIQTIIILLAAAGLSFVDQSKWEERPDFAKYFKEAGVEGAFLLYDLKNDKYLAYNSERLQQGYVPASTFKILNSLIALETGVIADENEIFKWDGTVRDVTAWNQDHNMRTAMKNSAVWFYQELARRIGLERMQHYVDLADYGNKNIKGGLDRFWLTGDLRITPREQIALLVRLHQNTLPFSQRAMDIVKNILIFEQGEDYVLRAKTGWSRQVGWFVGYVEHAKNVYFFATNIALLKPEDAKTRVSITKAILRDLSLIKE
ncbi:class D beta-lactamase [bacterium]|nr:class D beta-lactamase [bacterium]RIK57898.1 MAG: class D beta-lactamase [candidate division KSB1 bacterium]